MAEKPTSIFPTLRYLDADRAVDWLSNAFGLEQRFVHRGDDGKVIYAQLAIPSSEGNGMVMLSAARDESDFSNHQGPAAEKATQSSYIVVADADAHHDRAVSAGAKVVLPLNDEYGGRLYSCLDFEGHLWNFGTWDPWTAPES